MIAWDIPFEVVRALAPADGTAILLRLTLRQALFGAQARLLLVENRFVGEFTFEEPSYPGQIQTGAIQLFAVAQENSKAALERGGATK